MKNAILVVIAYFALEALVSEEAMIASLNGDFSIISLALIIAISALTLVVMDTTKKKRYKAWWVHNLFAHPLMEILSWMRLGEYGDWLHDATLPEDYI